MDENGAMLWGRVTYEMMEGYWPMVARGDVDAPPAMREWALKLEAKTSWCLRRSTQVEQSPDASVKVIFQRPVDNLVDCFTEVDDLHADIVWIGKLILKVEFELPRERQYVELRNTSSRETAAYFRIPDTEHNAGHLVGVGEIVGK